MGAVKTLVFAILLVSNPINLYFRCRSKTETKLYRYF